MNATSSLQPCWLDEALKVAASAVPKLETEKFKLAGLSEVIDTTNISSTPQ